MDDVLAGHGQQILVWARMGTATPTANHRLEPVTPNPPGATTHVYAILKNGVHGENHIGELRGMNSREIELLCIDPITSVAARVFVIRERERERLVNILKYDTKGTRSMGPGNQKLKSFI